MRSRRGTKPGCPPLGGIITGLLALIAPQGYLPVEEGVELYYAFWEVENPEVDPATAPIILWLQVNRVGLLTSNPLCLRCCQFTLALPAVPFRAQGGPG